MTPAHTFPYLNLYLHLEGPTVETSWLGFATGSEFRAGVLQALELGQQYHATGWVADDRLLGPVRPRDLQWCFEEVLLTLDKVGIRRFALLESQNAMNRRTIDAIYQELQPAVRFTIRRFTDLPQARAWAADTK
jgi:hypothetical protein